MRKDIFCGLWLLMMTALIIISPVYSAPLFPDVPESHWARDAVADLSAKGILEGYPDGTFKGDRSLTRWEMALMLQRCLARMEQVHATFASKSDLESVRVLTNQLKDELDAMGVRINNLEEEYSSLDKRTKQLERVRFYGYIHSIWNNMDVGGSLPNAGSRQTPVADWSNGRLLYEGKGFSAVGKLGTMVSLSPDSTLGIEFVSYYSGGERLVDQYWGVTPPYLSNPFTAQGSFAGGLTPKNNTPWNRMTLDRFWYKNKSWNTQLIIGSFQLQLVADFVFKGERNPNINPPYILPLYGVNVNGQLGKNSPQWTYEVLYSRLPQASFYTTQIYGGAVKYAFKDDKGWARATYTRTNNLRVGDGFDNGAGGVVMPAYPFAPGIAVTYWRNRAGQINNPTLGPQLMNVIALDLNYKFNKNWTGYIKFASSHYDPDTSNQLFTETATGSLVNAGVLAKFDKVDGKLEYVYVSPRYDPFILQYAGPNSGIPVFLPYSNYYFNYYQMHDYISYPNNRQGVNLNLGYDFSDKTRAQFSLGLLSQVEASTRNNFTKVGTIEPLFPYLQNGGSAKGKISNVGLWISHEFNNKLKAKVGYFTYNQRRSAGQLDDVDLKNDTYYANLSYPVNKTLDLYGNYYYVNYSGHLGLANSGFKQHIPSLSAVAKLGEKQSIGVTYRYYTLKNSIVKKSDWQGQQWIMEYKLKF